MSEYQTHTALAATLEAEIVRLRAVNAELRSSIQAPIQPDTKLVEAARQALEVLSELAEWESEGDPRHPASVAITALREALEAAPEPAAAEQEPVAHLYCGGQFGNELDEWEIDPEQYQCDKLNERFGALGKEARIPLYTAPQPARQPLTDAQIASACLSYRHDFGLLSKQEQESIIFQAREWERALGKEREIGGEA